MKKLKNYEVTMEVWRESYSGRDYHDGSPVRTVKACNAQSACKKAEKEYLNPGKGMRWSQSIWVQSSSAREV